MNKKILKNSLSKKKEDRRLESAGVVEGLFKINFLLDNLFFSLSLSI